MTPTISIILLILSIVGLSLVAKGVENLVIIYPKDEPIIPIETKKDPEPVQVQKFVSKRKKHKKVSGKRTLRH